MNSSLQRWLTSLAFCAVFGHDAAAQTFGCVPASAMVSTHLREYVARLTSDTALARKRQLYHLPQVSSSNLSVVTRTNTCADAARAYHTAVRGAGAQQTSRNVVVIKVSSSNYVVLDPAELEGEYEVTVIFDQSFLPLAAFNS